MLDRHSRRMLTQPVRNRHVHREARMFSAGPQSSLNNSSPPYSVPVVNDDSVPSS